ncbi:MAG: restriction endonuclease subunit S [bacterium]|nr:restriction endonuclease subunit S [bacterium]
MSISSLEDGRLDLEKSAHLSEEQFKTWTRRVTPEQGDVLFSYETRLGEAALMPGGIRACLGRRMGLLRPKREVVLPEYLLYAYLAPQFQEEIKCRTIHGATVERIALKELPDFPIRIPPIDEQEAVVTILGALDDKIALNRRMNRTLEAMVQAIFKSWFVDFEPVKAKAEARAAGVSPESVERAAQAAIAGRSIEGAIAQEGFFEDLDRSDRRTLARIAALFPDSFQDELCEIPAGWMESTVGEVADRIAMGPFGSRITRDNFVDSGVPVIRGGNLTRGFVDEGFVFLTEEKADELKRSNGFPGDIVFTHRGTIGQVGRIPAKSRFKRYVVSQSQMLLRANQKIVSADYLFFYFASGPGMSFLLSNASQVGVPAIARPATSLKAVPIRVPPKELVDRFDEVTNPLSDQMVQNRNQARTLRTLRDALLPRLLSGELEVPRSMAH